MRLSARNQIKGRILEVKKGATTAHVRVEITAGTVITASITNKAVDELGPIGERSGQLGLDAIHLLAGAVGVLAIFVVELGAQFRINGGGPEQEIGGEAAFGEVEGHRRLAAAGVEHLAVELARVDQGGDLGLRLPDAPRLADSGEFRVVAAASSSADIPRTAANFRAVSTMNAGSFRLPR